MDDFSAVGVLFDRFNTVHTVLMIDIAFGNCDDLAIGGLEAEAELAALVGVDFELGMLFGSITFDSLILYSGDGGILHDRLDALHAGGFGGINFRGGDDLTVGRLKIKLDACICIANDEFTNNDSLLL